MKVKCPLILILIQLFLSSLIAQDSTKIDSLLQVYKKLPNDTSKVNIIDDIFRYYRENDTSQLKDYARIQNTLSETIGYQKGFGKSFHNYARFYYHKKQWDSAKLYYAKALKEFEDINFISGQAKARWDLSILVGIVDGSDKKLDMVKSNIEFYQKIKDSNNLANSHHIEAQLHFGNDNYRLSLNKILKALKYFELNEDPIQLSNMFRLLCMIECELKHNEKALAYAIKSLDYAREDANSTEHYFAGMYNTMGNIYTQQQEFRKADSIFNKAMEIAKELDWSYLQKLILINHSRSYKEREDYNSALQKIETYLEIEKKFPDQDMSSLGPLSMGTALLNLNRAEEARIYLNKALIAAKKENLRRRLIPAYQNRAEANAKLNNYKEAYEDHKMYATLQDSVLNETKSQQIEEMRAIFDTEKKEQQIAQQETEISLLEEQEKVSNLQKILLGGGMTLSLIALGFGFYGFQQRTKRNQLEKEKVDAELQLKESELAFKKKELTTHALQLAKKNETLENLKQKATELKTSEVHNGYQQLIIAINFDLQDDNNWENFARYFEEVHKDFNSDVAKKYPKVTSNELRLMALLKMNLSSKEIANILNISIPGIKKARQRLRKKMQLSSTDSLENAVLSI